MTTRRKDPVAGLAAIVAATTALVCGPTAASLQEEGERLEAIRVELEARRSALRNLDDQRRSLVESLGAFDESLARLSAAVSRTARDLQARRAEVDRLERSVGYDEERLSHARARLNRRLRVLFVEGEGAGLRALLGAEDFTALALRTRLLQQLARADARLVQEVEEIGARIAERRRTLQGAAAELERALAQSAEQRVLLEAARAERQVALERIKNERALEDRRARELEDRKAQLAHLLRELVDADARRPLGVPVRRVGVLKAGLQYPVDGLVIRHFGAIKDRDSGAEIVSNGIEFRAAEGTPVVAGADGRVAHVGWMRGFGRVVILDHGAGHHTISAHLSATNVNAGDDVKRGQVVGAVGDTESTNGPKLYYELRENGLPRDPAPLLR